METVKKQRGRVRRNTSEKQNAALDNLTLLNLEAYRSAGSAAIDARIGELDREWDIERTLELNAAAFAFAGTVLGAFVNRRWLILPMVVTTFLAQHAVQGWCPPLPIFRKIGIRTRREIDRERYALKALRGDFAGVSEPEQVWQAVQ